ncbi:unnamed protein product [Cuscuta campestris]|uniref:C2H2-type domain-containing protein n=1 Tax=Cuscuta campestris TaxID=132261 RepID=A0A484L5D5_9ASTE|nr:unnamed protein product [Cuscuta campestris]
MQISREDSDSHQMALAAKCNPTKRRSGTSSPENSSCSTGGGDCHSSAAASVPNDEDEALANCLILLAGGGGGQTGPFAYRCKTCDRNFPSFQALGGHRASHKKPRTGFAAADEKEGPRSRTAGIAAPKNSSKTHECAVCGSEFGSGQALGGHMRRHRPVHHSPARPPTGSYGATHGSGSPSDGREMILALDLNLPPPMEEEEGEGEGDDLKMQNLKMILVGCHY